MDTTNPDDGDRRFVIAFYVADDTVQVREPPQRNSGIIGGSLLAKQAYDNPATGQDFKQNDFFVGANLCIAGRNFVILDVDEHTLKYMEGRPADYPLSNVQQVLSNLRTKLAGEARTGGLTVLFRKYDSDHSGKITIDEFAKILRNYDPDFPDQAVVTLMRQFDKSGDGTITVEEFIRVLEWDTSGPSNMNDSDYTNVAQEQRQREKMQLHEDAILAQFADEYMNKGSFSDLNRKLIKDGQGCVTRAQFVKAISMAEKATDSTTPNINLSPEHANVVANYIFENKQTLDVAILSQMVSHLNLTRGQRGHMAKTGDSWQKKEEHQYSEYE